MNKYYYKQRFIFTPKYFNIKSYISSTNQIRYKNDTENVHTKNESHYELSKKLWEFNNKKRYTSVISLFDQYYQGKPSVSRCVGIDIDYNNFSSDVLTPKCIYAAMLAYSEVLQPWKLIELIEKLHDEKFSHLSLCLLMHSYAKTDKLGSAERLIQAWIKHSCTTTKNATNLAIKKSFHEKFSIDSISKDHQSTKNKEMKLFLDEFIVSQQQQHHQQHNNNDSKYNPSNEIPIGVWISLLSIYNKRRAWRQCMHILQYLHDMTQANPEYYGMIKSSISSSESSLKEDALRNKNNHVFEMDKQLQKHLDELNYPTFMMTHKDILTTTLPLGLISQPFSLNTNSLIEESHQYLRLLQWNIMYHLVFRTLCETNQFKLCLDTIAQMKTYYIPANLNLNNNNNNNSNMKQQEQQVNMEGIFFLSPQLPTVISLLQGFTVSNPGKHYQTTTNNISINQNIVLSLQNNILETFYVLINDIPTPHTKRTANLLVREYLHALCKLGLVESAEDFVRSIQSQLTKTQQQKGIVINGFQSNNWIYPLILYLKDHGEWEKLHELYGKSIEPQFDEQNLQGIPYLQNNDEYYIQKKKNNNIQILNNTNTTNTNIDSLRRNEMIKNRNRVKKSSPTINMYHQACEGLRNAGQIEKLANLMDTYSPDMKKSY